MTPTSSTSGNEDCSQQPPTSDGSLNGSSNRAMSLTVVPGGFPYGVHALCGLKETGLVMPCCIKPEEPEGMHVNGGMDQQPPLSYCLHLIRHLKVVKTRTPNRQSPAATTATIPSPSLPSGDAPFLGKKLLESKESNGG
ncbi:hypothetical protein ACFX1Q_008326 [Malus domestica]